MHNTPNGRSLQLGNMTDELNFDGLVGIERDVHAERDQMYRQ